VNLFNEKNAKLQNQVFLQCVPQNQCRLHCERVFCDKKSMILALDSFFSSFLVKSSNKENCNCLSLSTPHLQGCHSSFLESAYQKINYLANVIFLNPYNLFGINYDKTSSFVDILKTYSKLKENLP